MSITPEEVADDVRRLIVSAEPKRWDDTQESWLARIAWKLGMDAGRIKRLFYREVRNVPSHEHRTIEMRVAAIEERQNRRQELLNETSRLVEASDSTAAACTLYLARAAHTLASWAEGETKE